MKRTLILMVAVVVGTGFEASPASADLGFGIFKKKPKAETPTRVKQLISTLHSDTDPQKRLAAAEEIRGIDPRTNPEIVPALIATLQKDPSPEVRSEAAESLGKMKPVDQPAGLALEGVLGSDPSSVVRDAAKDALWQYHLNGYRSPSADSQFPAQTAEPPFASRRSTTMTRNTNDPARSTNSTNTDTFRPISNSVGKGTFFQQTGEPPFSKAKANPESPVTTILPPPQPAPSVPDVKPIPAPVPTPAPAPVSPSPSPSPSFPMPMPPRIQPVPTITLPPMPTISAPPTLTPFAPSGLPSVPTIPSVPGS